jgi:flavin-binding protein dodecin
VPRPRSPPRAASRCLPERILAGPAPRAGSAAPRRAYDEEVAARARTAIDIKDGGEIMAKAKSSGEGVYRVTEVIGTSTKSWEDAAANAVTAASKTLRDLRIAEISKLDMRVEGGKVVAYRARVQLSFKYLG